MIPKRYLTDENHNPVAVVIDYAEWLRIEKQLGESSDERSRKLASLAGSMNFPMDGMEFQKMMRSEWDR